MTRLIAQFEAWLTAQGLSASGAVIVRWLVVAVAVTVLAWIVYLITRKVVLALVEAFARKSRTEWDDAMVRNKVFRRLSHISPALVLYFAVDLLEPLQLVLRRLTVIYMILVGLAAVFAFLNAAVEIYNLYPFARNRPIRGFVQVGKIVLSIFVGIVVVAMLVDRSPWYLLSGLGAMTAVLILVFKDSILGLVASIRLSANDLVAIGDWIEVPKYGADGDVIDVSLHHVTVQNWDKTLTTIPAYALVSDSFKNWRGMQESGGRRIKRSIHIDLSSVRFCSAQMLARLDKIQILKPYLDHKKEEIEAYNRGHAVDTSVPVNGRRLTNIGSFRAYVAAYLRSHSKINQEMTFLVRQLQPTDRGLPLEIYVFCADQAWANYEAIQADIFDHIMAAVPEFDLRIYQQPTGADMRTLAGAA